VTAGPAHDLRQAEADLALARNALERAATALTSPDKLVITNAPVLRFLSAQIAVTALAVASIRRTVEFGGDPTEKHGNVRNFGEAGRDNTQPPGSSSR
jgi:hypothetical protein